MHESIKRSREGIRTVLLALAVLGLAAVVQTVIFALSGSVALLADLIHNFGDALTAVPLGVAFWLRSPRAERGAGLFVVAAIFISACVSPASTGSRRTGPGTRVVLGGGPAAGRPIPPRVVDRRLNARREVLFIETRTGEQARHSAATTAMTTDPAAVAGGR